MFHGIPVQGVVPSSLALPGSRPLSPSQRRARLNERRIPPEIWLEVFVHATWDSAAFFIANHHDVFAFAVDKYGTRLHDRFNAAMDVNRSLSLVCKTWNTLVQDNMFKYILVRSGDHAIRVATILENRKFSPSSTRRPGWWTIRLEVAINRPCIWTAIHTDALARIVQNCPNLVVFSTCFSTNGGYHSSALIHDLPKYHAHGCLRRLELKGDASFLLRVVSMLASSLEILCISPSRKTSAPISWTCHLPRLHTFISTFAPGSNMSIGWDMPSLRTLIGSDTLEIIQRAGHQLRYLSSTYMPSASLMLCPNLHELVIIPWSPPEYLFDGVKVHASLRCIIFHYPAIISCNPTGTFYNDEPPTTLALCSSLHFFFPSLKYIRLQLSSSRQSSLTPRVVELWKTWLDRCHAHGITVQYHRGAEDWSINPDWQLFTTEFIENGL